jgi:hypothetical protein
MTSTVESASSASGAACATFPFRHAARLSGQKEARKSSVRHFSDVPHQPPEAEEAAYYAS